MRNIQHRRTSLSSNSRSLDSTIHESFNVKIHVNDLTPAPSQECLNLCSPVSEDDFLHPNKLLSDGTNTFKTCSIGGTASKRLEKRANKKTPARRQSWSSVGASTSPEEDKQLIQRRWSLSSLDSDSEEAFCKSTNTTGSFRFKGFRKCHSYKSATHSGTSRDKSRNHSDGSCEESLLSKSSKQSSSFPSMHSTTADIKENVEPQKTQSVGSLSSSAKNFLVSFRNHPLQKSLSTPSINVEDEVGDQAKEDIHSNRQSLCTMHPLPLHDLSPQLHESLDCDENNPDIQQVSLTSLIRDVQMNSVAADSDEEKVFIKRKKRSSIFFKKKPDKQKSKEGKKAHQFIVYTGSIIACDVCQKPFNKKQTLKCENCLVVVHDSACKDQVVDCNKFKLQRTQSKHGYTTSSKDMNVIVNGNSGS
ncbi:uncharacterized protein LOC129230278 [Uloborus diversus]|uniref:uncharacterized protein LOC129230278 n=1 Tax=Uloborus diversus TaxID=327109 RepID=UPI0024093FF8|nr:uncharacterized protein LOC129230278 [Uloborus diversus]